MKAENNILGVREMGITPLNEFMGRFMGKPVGFWFTIKPTMVTIGALSGYEFVKSTKKEGETEIFVFRGTPPSTILSVEKGAGFGIWAFGEKEKYWVDKFNEDELVYIMYRRGDQ